ncbi:hypothetical protein [Pseudarthrobacter raffinosi]|uniref:hypothetical protein n=1 Tax=Pseudarthrobacter raffinosi TaxID=2953651 RepID=UPI00208F1C10|nr:MULTISPECIES: hypothetical protein [unclassified Pseudarthrobacter]MCO4236361.1 hypothetical protein [Pseudarthrobacter sp. MDT3-28]MCO4253380.1 hypothetical protein [Pseudarthrobacter sp. MDT3-9]MCO4262288.1 hypothetical protein [Pseudarthrobacter sp. MDT3-26]
MSLLSLASRQAGPASRASCRNWWALLPWPSHHLARRRSHHFPVIAASGFWVTGVSVLAVLAVGAGHVALNQIRTISASAGVNAARASIQKAEAKALRAKNREEEQKAVASQVPEHNERPARRIG